MPPIIQPSFRLQPSVPCFESVPCYQVSAAQRAKRSVSRINQVRFHSEKEIQIPAFDLCVIAWLPLLMACFPGAHDEPDSCSVSLMDLFGSHRYTNSLWSQGPWHMPPALESLLQQVLGALGLMRYLWEASPNQVNCYHDSSASVSYPPAYSIDSLTFLLAAIIDT